MEGMFRCAVAFVLLIGCSSDQVPSPLDGAAHGSDGGAPDRAGGGSEWLRTVGNHIVRADGRPWHGRGANLHDTRSCNACTHLLPSAAEVKRRADELIDGWKANFVRLDLESYSGTDGYRVQWKSFLDDPGYLADLQDIVAHLSAKPDVYVLLSIWNDPSLTPVEWPTAQTQAEWRRLAQVFRDQPRVLYGLVNEPHDDPSRNGPLAAAMNATVQAIRDVEDAAGSASPRHVVVVQGTNLWARTLDYWVAHPITAGGGGNIAYETHPYNPTRDFDALFIQPARTLPVLIGEFGPFDGVADADLKNLMETAERLEIPYLAWNFHHKCPPNLLKDTAMAGCGIGMTLLPTAWGTLLKDRLANPW